MWKRLASFCLSFLTFHSKIDILWSWRINNEMARPKEFNRDQVLEKAMGLFWEKGYDGSSVENLVQCTGIGRGSLYDTFSDKHALYLAALDRYMRRPGGALTDLQRQEGSFRDQEQQDTVHVCH